MTAIRLLTLPAHGVVELLIGLSTMAAPFVVGFGPAATLVALLVGAVLVGLALAAASAHEGGRGSFNVATHHAADSGLAIGLFGAAATVGIDGDATAAVTLAALALAQTALTLTTRYSLRA
ncbi:MAG: SPW repeat protein [Solirubrobacterales bacterium]|nr:SPW repeat protein [Solirubrobacterales bacterium]